MDPNDQAKPTDLFTDVLNWAREPFNSQGNAFTWVLWVGLIVIAIWFWNHVIMTINKEV